jgi:mannan endo-1,4-beta-mannosidase
MNKWVVSLLLLITQLCPAQSGFVQTRGKNFIVNGRNLRFAGCNNYYLHCKPHVMIDDVLENASAMGLSVIRCWGFIDGESHDGFVIQPQMGEFQKAGLERLDYTLARAGQLGLRLIVVLTNNWPDFGGMIQYVRWVNDDNAQSGTDKDLFYTDEKIREAFKNYIRFLLNHTNPYTGILYQDDPTIFAWELANEPRCPSDKTGDTLVNWVSEMSTFIKSIDSLHLVGVGDEGFLCKPDETDWTRNGNEGVDWHRLIELPAIDFGTVHLYPDSWNKTVEWGNEWIIEHARYAHEIDKPVIIEEYGIHENKIEVYTMWGRLMEKYEVDGSLFWILSGVNMDSIITLYGDYDRFRVVHPSPESAVLADHASRMNDQSEVKPLKPYVPAAPSDLHGSLISGQLSLNWQDNSSNEDGFIILYWSQDQYQVMGWAAMNQTSWSQHIEVGSISCFVQAMNKTGFSLVSDGINMADEPGNKKR